MRPAIEPDRPLLGVGAQEVLDGDDILGAGIALFLDANADGPSVDVGRDVSAALVLRKREPGGVPTVGVLTARGVERHAQVVAECGAGTTFGLIFVEQSRPVAVQDTLSGCRRADPRQ